jgi:hypothetical protein
MCWKPLKKDGVIGVIERLYRATFVSKTHFLSASSSLNEIKVEEDVKAIKLRGL